MPRYHEAPQMPQQEGPVGQIKSRKWLPGNIVALPARKLMSHGRPTGEIMTVYRLEDGLTEFGKEVTDREGNLLSREMYVKEGDKTRHILWEPQKDEVSEYVTDKDERGITSSGWKKIG
jgi:hypothetical protein